MLSSKSELIGARLIDIIWDAYCAGFLDGEGCFSYRRLIVSNTYPVPLFVLQERFKGTVRKRKQFKKTRPVYEWAVHGEAVDECLKRVLPYLLEKKQQALLILEMSKYPAGSAQRTKMGKELREAKRTRYD